VGHIRAVSLSIKDVTAFWDRRFREIGSEFGAVRAERIAPIIARLQEHRVSTVFDMGCGCGRWSIPLAQEGFAVTAVDISEEAINLLKAWAIKSGLKIKVNISAAQHLTECDGPYDAVVCSSVLDHMTFADAVLSIANIHRILKIDGIAFLAFDGLDESDADDFESLADGSRVYTSGNRKGMIWRFFSNEEIRRLVRDFKLTQFDVRANSSREIWLRKAIA
jgi:2-polyprenyl-3-methyl-5-hydroxy-6-metoxy-1,4-benzoquinol methylase